MSDEPPNGEPERRLGQLLELIRQAPPEPAPDTAMRVLASARWERGVRSTGSALGRFGGSFAAGLAILVGIRRAP
jgi:hypothetical protein